MRDICVNLLKKQTVPCSKHGNSMKTIVKKKKLVRFWLWIFFNNNVKVSFFLIKVRCARLDFLEEFSHFTVRKCYFSMSHNRSSDQKLSSGSNLYNDPFRSSLAPIAGWTANIKAANTRQIVEPLGITKRPVLKTITA